MKILALMLASVAAFAQSFPGSVYTPLIAANNVQTTLTSPMAAIDTVAIVAASSGWANNMLAYICDSTTSTVKCTGTYEIMKVTNVAGNVLTVTRGIGGTSAIAHASGKMVLNAPVALYNKTVSDEIFAVETALGANLSNVPPVITALASSYNFAAQHPAGTISPGTTVITMTPVPLGVNGTDVGHYLYVAATGTPEACLINGGAGTSGQTSGQISLSCLNAHSAGFSVASATGGIREAIQAVTATGGTVTIDAATHLTYSQIIAPSNVTLQGLGPNSIIQLAANQWPASNAGAMYNGTAATPVVLTTTNAATGVKFLDFTLDMNGANNPNMLFGTALAPLNAINVDIERVTVTGMKANGQMIGLLGASGYGGTIFNNVVHGYGGGISACAGGIFVQSPKTVVSFNKVDNLCDEAYISNGPGAVDVLFSFNELTGNASAVVTGFHAENSSRGTFSNNVCRGALAACINIAPTGAAGTSMIDFTVTDNMVAVDGGNVPQIGVQISGDGSGHTAIGAVVKGNLISGASIAGIVGSPTASKLTIANNVLHGNNTGILLQAGNDGSIVTGNILYTNSTNLVATGATNFLLEPNITDDTNNLKARLFLGTFANLPACAGAIEGMQASIGDSTTATWGAVVAGGGVNHVATYCNGTNWTVTAK